MTSNRAIHWIGVGLSSGPGIMALAQKWDDITVWDMTLNRAQKLKNHLSEKNKFHIQHLNLDDGQSRDVFSKMLNPGDVVISMLPASFHVKVAQLALARNCHMVTSSYLSEDMLALHDEAVTKDLCIVNEAGLDPGIDHLLTHILIDTARKAGQLGQGNTIDFTSYCGGVPVEKTPFTYKFSWTPLGVLTALKSQAQMIRNGLIHDTNRVWEDVSQFNIDGENFEVYPNRDSLPYVTAYGLENEQNLRTFVRGTLRLSGWKDAWRDIFVTLDNASPKELKALSDNLWRDHQYHTNEQDRVVLHVALSSTAKNGSIWQAALSLDQKGTGLNSAMASCVSLTIAEAVNAVMADRLPAGVQAVPRNVTEARLWLKGLQDNGISIKTTVPSTLP